MERLNQSRPKGLSSGGLRAWAMLFLIAGVVGRGILQNRLLGIGQLTGQQLLEVMSSSSEAMAIATAALIMQALETCAIPLFSMLLVEGFLNTKDRKRYFLRVAVLALISEIPFNLACGGAWMDTSSRNPAFGLVIGMVMLYLFSQFQEKTGSHRFVKLLVVVMSVFWVEMLGIDHGTPMIFMIGMLWLSRNRQQFRSLMCGAAAMLCTLISPFYLVAAMGCLPVHLYNGEKGPESRFVNYAAYPVVLLAVGLIAQFVI